MKYSWLPWILAACCSLLLPTDGRRSSTSGLDVDVLYHSKENPSKSWEATISIESSKDEKETDFGETAAPTSKLSRYSMLRNSRRLPSNKSEKSFQSRPTTSVFFRAPLSSGLSDGSASPPGRNLTSVSSANFLKQSRLKGITDLVLYPFHRKNQDQFQSRTGLLLVGAVTAIELFAATGLFVGITTVTIVGLMFLVKIMSLGGLLMIG